MDMTWEIGRWRGGRLWIKGRTNEQESRERGTGETRNGQTGQRANVTGRRGCEVNGIILDGWMDGYGYRGRRRRDETRREREKKRVDGKEQHKRQAANQLHPGEREKEQPATAKAPPRKYTRRDEQAAAAKMPGTTVRYLLRITRGSSPYETTSNEEQAGRGVRGAWSVERGEGAQVRWFFKRFVDHLFPLHPHPLGFLDSPPRVNPLPQVCAGCCCCTCCCCYYS